MDPGILIPVKGYGGHERLIEIFAKEYTNQGHKVSLLVTEGSYVENCTVHSLGKEGFPQPTKDRNKTTLTAWKYLWKYRNEFDLVHNFGRLLYLLPILNLPVKKIMTYGREITGSNINKFLKLPNKNIVFTGCSKNLISRSGAVGNWHTIYNAIDFNKYNLTTNVEEDAPLIFLGRIEKVKGCHTAIAVAKATGNKLIIAGNISPLEDEKLYFEKEIEPLIDGVQIKYIGAVNDVQKNECLGKSKALLMPIEWNEPFGIVMIEAMACGTPVIAFDRGSVSEVVEDGITGFKVPNFNSMVDKLNELNNFNRSKCRDAAKFKFDILPITRKYLELF